MKYTASEIAEILDGFVVGDDDACVTSISKIEEAQKGSLAFLANPKYTEFLYSTKASVTLVRDSFQPDKEISTTLVKVADPYLSFTMMLSHFNESYSKKNLPPI